jgi:hypothetical protein
LSKRTRGSANRNAQRKPANRPATTRAPAGRPANTARPVAGVAAAEFDVAERETSPEPAGADVRGASSPVRSRAKPSGMLAARAATEYVYVAQDLRRIVAVAALLFGIMFALWILFEVARIRI